MESQLSFRPVEPVTVKQRSVPLWQLGEGEHVLFLLPGYRQHVRDWQQWLPTPIDGWRIVLIGVPGSVVKATSQEPEWQREDWLEVIRNLRTAFSPEQEAWLGYSLGGRLLLHVAGLAQSGINRLLLMSPDGLDPSLSEWMFLYHRWGQRPMRWLIRHPRQAERLVDLLRKLGLMSRSGHYFAKRQLQDVESLTSGYEVVRIYTDAQPQPSRLRREDRQRNMLVCAIWGDADQVRPVSQSRKLWKYFQWVHLITAPGGHVWPASHPDILREWIEMALFSDPPPP